MPASHNIWNSKETFPYSLRLKTCWSQPGWSMLGQSGNRTHTLNSPFRDGCCHVRIKYSDFHSIILLDRFWRQYPDHEI